MIPYDNFKKQKEQPSFFLKICVSFYSQATREDKKFWA